MRRGHRVRACALAEAQVPKGYFVLAPADQSEAARLVRMGPWTPQGPKVLPMAGVRHHLPVVASGAIRRHSAVLTDAETSMG
jgi:hypothetical protein